MVSMRIESTLEVDLGADAMFTALLYCYNTMDDKAMLVAGDLPMLIQRDTAGRKMRMQEAKDMFECTCEQWENQKLGFNP